MTKIKLQFMLYVLDYIKDNTCSPYKKTRLDNFIADIKDKLMEV